MNDEDLKIVAAMLKYGGGFVKSLAVVANNADMFNLKRLKAAFPEYWEQYEELAKQDNDFREGMNKLL